MAAWEGHAPGPATDRDGMALPGKGPNGRDDL